MNRRPSDQNLPDARAGNCGRNIGMDEAEFDQFADEYEAMHKASIAISGETPDFFAEYKIQDIVREYERHSGPVSASTRVLDFGSGNGGSVPFVRKHLPPGTIDLRGCIPAQPGIG